MIDFSKYKAAIFDWDGTLVESHEMLLNAHNKVRIDFGEPEWSMEEFMSQPSLSAKEFFSAVYPNRAEEADQIFYDFIGKHHLDFLQPMAKAEELLKLINKVPLGIVSNKRYHTLNIEVDHMNWRHYFKTIIGAGQADRDKPAPDPLLMAMNEIHEDLTGKDILYFGDTETDLLTAQAVGADVVFIQSDRPRPDLIEKYEPTYHFHSIEELITAVTNECSNANDKVD